MKIFSVTSSPSKQVHQLLRAIFICFFISGVAGLIYEILWIRMLGLVFGHTVHAITTVLVAFMTGLALGSYLLRAGSRPDSQPPETLWSA